MEQEESNLPNPRYAIREVADMTGISAYTLRYYDKCGFFPDLFRDKHNVRHFSDEDIRQLHLVDALRKSGLSIDGIKYFVRIGLRGKTSTQEQFDILETQEKVLEYQLAETQNSLRVLQMEKNIRANSL